MALSLKINGTNRVTYLDRDSLSIEQDASSYAATCSFNLIDEDGSLAIAELDEVLIEDGSDVLFHGEIAHLDDEQIVTNNKTARRWICSCHDDHIELENRTVEYATWEDLLYSDIEMIDDLFDAYYSSGIDYSTYVVGTPLEPAMTELTFEGITMREAISRIAERSGGQFYVHYASGTLYFHYFDSESNVAAFHLTDDSPNYADAFPYNEIHPEHDATELINAVYVVGKDMAKWITDATSISAYGRREAGVSNPDLLTEDAIDDFGATFIAEHKDPKLRYRVITPYGSGLRAGMQIRLVCAAKSIDSTLNINRLQIYYVEDTPYWELELGDTASDFVSSARSLSDDLTQVMTQVTAVHEDVFDTTAPSAPSFVGGNLTTGVSIDADGHQVVWIQATWGSVADADLDHYDIQISTASDFSTFVDTRRHPADGDRIERFTGLLGNTTYYVRVRAVDWVGNYSSWVSQNITSSKDSSAPTTPTGLAAAGARMLIGVSWDANTEADLGHYELQRAPDSGGSPGAWSTISKQKSTYFVDEDFTEAEIQASTTFHYQVRAVDTSGNNSSYASSVSASLNALGSDSFAAESVIAAKIGAGAVTTDKLDALAVTTAKIDAGAVTAAKISVSQLSAISADMGTLTAGEIRVGTGTPGVNFTGFRIFSSYIAGYNNDTAQFYVNSSDGKAYTGGGVVVLDENGLAIELTTSLLDVRSYQFTVSGTVYSRIAARYATSLNTMHIELNPITAKDSQFYIGAVSPNTSGRTSLVQVGAHIYGGVAAAVISCVAYQTGDAAISLTCDTLSIIGGSIIQSTPLCAFVYRSTTQSFTNAWLVRLSWDTEVVDTDGIWAAGSPQQFIPTHAGYYVVGASVVWDDPGGACRLWLGVRKNGTTLYGNSEKVGYNGALQGLSVVSGAIYCNGSTDYIEVLGYQNSGGALDVTAASAANMHQNSGWIMRIA